MKNGGCCPRQVLPAAAALGKPRPRGGQEDRLVLLQFCGTRGESRKDGFEVRPLVREIAMENESCPEAGKKKRVGARTRGGWGRRGGRRLAVGGDGRAGECGGPGPWGVTPRGHGAPGPPGAA